MTMAHRIRILALAAVAVVALGGCSGGYLIDASEQGGQAFIGFVLMVVIFALGLFYMDRIRQKRQDREDEKQDQSR